MKRLIAIAAAALAILGSPPGFAQEAPKRLNERGCAIAADMVIVARSLAVEKVDPAQAARIMGLVYAGLGDSDLANELRQAVTRLAYGRTEPPAALAQVLMTACLTTGGDFGAMFGTRIRDLPRARPGLRV